MIIKDEKGYDWYVNDVRTNKEEDAKIFDKSEGDERVIRVFIVTTDPSKTIDTKELLEFHTPQIKANLYKDGWVLDQDLRIEKVVDGHYQIFAIAKPAAKHGSIIGATDANPLSANEVLKKEQDKQE